MLLAMTQWENSPRHVATSVLIMMFVNLNLCTGIGPNIDYSFETLLPCVLGPSGAIERWWPEFLRSRSTHHIIASGITGMASSWHFGGNGGSIQGLLAKPNHQHVNSSFCTNTVPFKPSCATGFWVHYQQPGMFNCVTCWRGMTLGLPVGACVLGLAFLQVSNTPTQI